MKLWGLAAACAVLAGANLPTSRGGETLLVLGGDTDGMLAPCGCTKPMSGGILRRVSAVRTLVHGKSAVVLENGGLIAEGGRQDELKAETLAETLTLMGAAYVHVGPSEARLGKGLVTALGTLAPGRLLSSSVAPSATNPLTAYGEAGPFMVGGASTRAVDVALPLGERPVGIDAAVDGLVAAAQAAGKSPLLLLRGSLDDARQIAQRHPELRLVQYRASGSPAAEALRMGETWLVSPGEDGKHLLRLVWRDGAFREYAAVALGPEYPDDPDALRAYNRYLARVGDEHLLEKTPRSPGDAYAGTKRCGSCHASAHRVWSASAHSHALATLEKSGHDRDPDCVGCHVVGLVSKAGFYTRAATPQLADVGCESCHGAGLAHSVRPKARPMRKVGNASCAKCHVPKHSPTFVFADYWKRIAHPAEN